MTFTTGRLDRPQDKILFGVNTTRLNREHIITFRPKKTDGTYGPKRFLTARQMCEMLGETQRLANVIARLERSPDIILIVKLRETGLIRFNAR